MLTGISINTVANKNVVTLTGMNINNKNFITRKISFNIKKLHYYNFVVNFVSLKKFKG